MKATHKDWILFNGRMINTKEEQPMVALEERGFQFGDGFMKYLDYTMASLIY